MRLLLSPQRGFTLIELSIVLVIIGLIAGGILVGRDLVTAAEVRGTITQFERYNTAVNTFRLKFNALPGDMIASKARQFGFAPRGLYPGEGDGNGVIEGINVNGSAANLGDWMIAGETPLFWVDLSKAGLIEGSFNTASANALPAADVGSSDLPKYFPQAKLGRGNYIYVWSGGSLECLEGLDSGSDGINYFGMAAISSIPTSTSAPAATGLTLTVAETYNIDAKIDDGLPQAGKVLALYNAPYGIPDCWAAGGGVSGAYDATTGGPTTAATPGSATTCYDNGNTNGATQRYSLAQNGGDGPNCALSVKFH